MPAITITAVDTAADKLTAVAHGLLTGGRFRLRNVGGALPTGTSPTVDYFAVRVDADNIKVATSSANALAGTPVVDITGAGSGTNSVEYGLPYCIPDTLAAAGTQVKSFDLNGTWNALVSLYDFLTAQTQTVLSSIVLAANQDIQVQGTGKYKHGTQTLQLPINNILVASGLTADDFAFTSGTNGWDGYVVLPVGKRITAIRARIKDSVTGPTTCRGRIFSTTDGAASAALGTTNTSAGSGAAQTIVATGLAITVAALTTYRIVIDGVAGTQLVHVYAVEVDYDQP